MIQKVLDVDANQALNGTTILNTLALEKGANILRVHDVKETKRFLDVLLAIENIWETSFTLFRVSDRLLPVNPDLFSCERPINDLL